ncbi:MAG: hypothetical protein L0154_31145 [Chloroflexi bacterium]|nr:hypothetical protein [Chloroflexota bacterium]
MSNTFEKEIIWVHWMGRVVREESIRELAETVKAKCPSVTGIAIKTNDGVDWQGRYDTDPAMEINGPQDIFKWARELARNGLQTHLWCVVRGVQPDAESDIIVEACNVPGVRSMILDVEGGPQYFGGRPPEVARHMIERIRAGIASDFHLALNYDYRGSHPDSIHFDEWLPHVQSLHPMVYHWHFSESTKGPQTYLEAMFNNLRVYNLPIVPMLQAYPDPSTDLMVPETHMYQAGYYSFEHGATGISYFRLGTFVEDEHYAAVGRIKPDEITVIPPPSEEEEDPASTFQVVTLALNVRTKPTLEPRTLIPGIQLNLGDRVEVLPTSRLENQGYVWWRHRDGWSAEKAVSGSPVYMVRAADLDPTPTDSIFQVVTLALNVRTQPSLDPSTLTSTTLRMGETVKVVPGSRRDTLGYVWWQHDLGWSAEKRSDNTEIFMADVNTELPGTAFVITKSPMDLDDMEWFYYYGNTRFAFLYGSQHNYDGYSQGLHGGLDYGYPAQSGRTIPIFAGVHGTFDYGGSGRAFGPNRVDILVEGYRIIYGHIAQPLQLAKGTPVNPDTVVGVVDVNADHMHLEIRKSGYIYNPLLFMTKTMREKIFDDFPPVGSFAFYQSTSWNKWITPLDQPVITIGGPVIGPRA